MVSFLRRPHGSSGFKDGAKIGMLVSTASLALDKRSDQRTGRDGVALSSGLTLTANGTKARNKNLRSFVARVEVFAGS